MTDDVTFWFDPSCPFTWRTSRWLRGVIAARGLSIGWRLMSLAMLNEGKEIPERYRDAMARSIRGVRLLYAVDQRYDWKIVDRLYAELGTRLHVEHRVLDDDVLDDSLAGAELPGTLVQAADDTGLDPAIRESHRAGQQRVGTESGSPILAIGDGPGFFGPVVVPVPAGEAAEKLFDAVRLISAVPEFSELKRARAAF